MIKRFFHILLHQRYPLLVCVVTLFMLGLIEWRHPYFFLQDDNRVLFFPLFVDNFRALLGGEFPLFNFHQFLGIPTGMQAHALYLPNYMATGLSWLLLGHYFGAIEILAIFHLVIAALGFYFLMRSFDLDERSCCLNALAWPFSSFVMTVGNSWIHVSGCAAYLPWILLFSLRQIKGFELADFTVLVLLKAALILTAHPQYTLYVFTFEFITLVLVYGADSFGKKYDGNARQGKLFNLSGHIVLNNFCAALLTSPYLLQGVREAAFSSNRNRPLSWEDYSDSGYNLMLWLNGVISPLRDVGFKYWNEQNFITHIGYLPLLFIALAVFWIRSEKNWRYVAVFLILGLFSLFWASNTIITEIFYYMPVYNKFRTPFKLAFFTSFFLIVISTFGADWLFKRIIGKMIAGRSLLFLGFMTVQLANVMILYAGEPLRTFVEFKDRVPVIEPLKALLESDGGGRIISAGTDIVRDGEKVIPGYSAPLLGYNYATLFGLFQAGGYTALIPEKNFRESLGMINSSVFSLPVDEPFEVPAETLQHYRTWGVKWYVVDSRIPLPSGNVFKLVHSDMYRNVLKDELARPLAYWRDAENVNAGHLEVKTNSITLKTKTDSNAELVLNVLHNQRFSAAVDGVSASVTETADARVSIAVPAGQHEVRLTYSDRPFVAGVVVSACFSLCAVVCLFLKNIIN